MSSFRDFTKPEKGRAGFGTAQVLNKVILMTLLIISLQFPAEHNLLLLQVVDLDEGGDEGPE